MKKTWVLLLSLLLFFLVLVSTTSRVSSKNLPELSLLCPSQVNESAVFIVTVTSENTTIANATVIFNGQTNLTNAAGKATFQAPRVLPNENNTYLIIVSKQGFNTTTCSLTIINVPQLFPLVDNGQFIENTTVVVTVIDEQGRMIENATIVFDANEYQTNKNGTATFQTPPVRNSETYTITARKTGYLENSILIIVSPRPSQENILGFLLLIGICLMIAACSMILILRKYLKQQKINRR